MFGLLDVIAPLLAEGRERLEREARLLEGPFDAANIGDILFAGLPQHLLELLARTLILEMHVARLQGLLHGDTPQERFASFVEHLRQSDVALGLLQEYPVLARMLTRCIANWVASGLEFLEHLCDDWPALRRAFAADTEPRPLVEVAVGGDHHRGGRAVRIARFASGLRLVYKPRSLAIEAHFQELLTWANERGAQPAFRLLHLLDRGDHGWVEFVSQRDCGSPLAVQRFYERLGGQLALVHALAGSDLHYENVVAVGEHPMLVDLEVLFHPHPPGWSTREPAEQALADSILGTGLLPRREFTEGGADGADISGLGAAPGQLSPAPEFRVEGLGTDEMRLVRRRVELAPGRHLPTLNGTPVDPLAYAGALEDGFRRSYGLLLEHRAELLARGGLLERCGDDVVRYVARPTRTYAILLQQSLHPDRLRDPMEQKALFDRLRVGTAHHAALASLLPHEREELDNGDVPIFMSRPASCDLWASSGERITGFFEGSGIARVRQRLAVMGEADLERQLSIMHAALATLPTANAKGGRPICRRGIDRLAKRAELLKAAHAIGDRLDTLAWRKGAEVGWLGLSGPEQGRWGITALGTDLYDGLPGLALFLAHLGACTGEERFPALARAALEACRRRLQPPHSPLRSIGAFDGWGGIIYTLTHLGILWNEPALVTEAERCVAALPRLIDQDEDLDVVGGAAGCLLCLLGLYRSAVSAQTLAVALQCGERLLLRCVKQHQGIGWPTPAPPHAPLTGLAHGVAGIAWALSELATATGDERFRTAAMDGLAYERGLFDSGEGNWPDLRRQAHSGEATPAFGVAWCHGAPGIGLARLRTLAHVDDPAIRAEIDAALTTTRSRGFGFNHTLCHGDLGNLELLLEAATTLDHPAALAEARRQAGRILDSIRNDGWLCATPRATQSPGLMTGLAGIGYALLRLAEPERVPSVLTLSLPHRFESCSQ
jgi:type 2 lantibiotic biosynthesis protein LanM